MLPLGFVAFVLFGVLLVLPGASQDALARALELDLQRSGLLGALLAAGIGVGVLAAGPLVDRRARRPLFVGAAGLAGAALAGIGSSAGFVELAARVALAGVGAGVFETLLNAVAVERYGAGAARRIVALHAGASVGAVAGPALVRSLDAWGGWATAFRATGGALLVLAVAGLAGPFGRPQPRSPSPGRPTPTRLLTAGLVALCAVGFAYVGVETALTLFAVPYARTGLGIGAERGRVAISAFWLGLLGSRMLLAARRGSFDARFLAVAGAAGAGLLLAGVATGVAQLELLLVLVGLAMGGVFPLMVALAGQGSPHARGAATGLVAGAGAAGGFAVPWLTGWLGDRIGITAAMGSLVAWCLAIVAAALAVRRSS